MLDKQTFVDSINALSNGCIEVRTVTVILDDNNFVSKSFHRHVVVPGQIYNNEDTRVQAVCSALHTPEVISAYADSLLNINNNQ
jgi:hypothetical protein